jgi:hypothetical protein
MHSSSTRTQKSPHRTTLVIHNTHQFSIHTVLLTSCSPKLSTLLKQYAPLQQYTPFNSHYLPIASGTIAAWHIFIDWLYTLDKIPLPDFTPLRFSHWTTRALREAVLLADWLGCVGFEKYLLRLVMKEVYEVVFPERELQVLKRFMGKGTGLFWFARAWGRWREGRRECDPLRWRVEHWYVVSLFSWFLFAMSVRD